MGFEIGKVTRLRLGYVGEHVARKIEIDVSAWLDKWPDALIHMTVKRPNEDDLYIPATDIKNGMLVWEILQSDIAIGGVGVAQIRALDRASGACYMSRVVETIIDNSMDGATDENAPDKAAGWVNRVIEAAASVADRAEELDALVDEASDAIESADTAAANAGEAAADAWKYAETANTAAMAANQAEQQAKTAADNADAAAEDADRAADNATSASEAANDAAAAAMNAAQEANASATNADSMAVVALSAANSASAAADEASVAARNANAAAADTRAATQAVNAAIETAQDAANEATKAATAASASSTEADAAAQRASSAATNANNKAAEAGTAANAATSAASNANAATSSANAAATAANNAAKEANTAAANAEVVANLTVEAETLNPGSQATAQYKGGKLTLGIPRGEDGSSGAGMPVGEAPYQMLVTDPDGNAQWVDRTHYEYPGETIIPLHDMEMKNGYKAFTEPFERIPTPGRTYHITYYGYHYDVVAEEWMDGDVRCISLGNKRLIGGYISPEPFIFVFYADGKQILGAYGYFSCDSDTADSIAVSIESVGELKKIDPKFLPEGSGGGLPTGGEPYKQLVTDGEGNAVWEDRLAYENNNAVVLPETELVGGGDGQFYYMGKYDATVQPGDKCVVTYNGVDYSLTAGTITEGGTDIVVLGNLGAVTGTGDTGEPFLYMIVPDEVAASVGATGMVIPFDGAETVTVKITGGASVEKVDPKFLPEGIGYETPNTLSLVMGACNIIHDPGGDYRTENTLTEDLVVGAEYTIVFDGVEYKTSCKATGVSSLPYVPFVLGNPALFGGEDTGEPFTFFCGGKAGEHLWYGGSNNDFLQSTIEVFKGSSGGIHTIPMKYLPDYLYGQEGDMSEVLPENVPGDSIDGTYTYSVLVPFASHLVPEKEYVVTYNGDEYRCTCKISGYMECPCVGDQALTDYPFYVIDTLGENANGSNVEYGKAELKDAGATIAIRNGGILRKIDPKFLPEGYGGGLPTGGEPYKQLVTDGEGSAVWEDRLAYGFTRVILPETTVTQDNNFSILTPFTNFPVPDETYTVVYDGKEYVCKAQAVGSESVVLGNPAETPFMLQLFVDMFAVNSTGGNIYGAAMSTEGKMSFSLSIIQKVSHKVAPKFLPDGIGYKIPDTIIAVMDRCECDANQERQWFTKGLLEEDLVAGAEYTVLLDEVEYKTICKTTDTENAPFVLGNPATFGGEDTGEHFTLYGSGKTGDLMWFGAYVATVVKISRTVYGEVKKIDPELLPMDAIAQAVLAALPVYNGEVADA